MEYFNNLLNTVLNSARYNKHCNNIDDIERNYGVIFTNRENYSDVLISIFNASILDVNYYDLNDSNVLYFIGMYYKFKEKNYDKMKYYFLKAIKNNHTDSMASLGYYYDEKQNYDIMKQYYLISIKNNDSSGMNNLGFYYQYTEKNYDKMKYYYLMAIENNNVAAMINLRVYYKNINKLTLFYFNLLQQPQNELIKKTILKLNNEPAIQHFNNKIILFKRFNNYKQCILCHSENVLNIDLKCGHEICIECYQSNMKCYYSFCK